jgi:hypothetical protein
VWEYYPATLMNVMLIQRLQPQTMSSAVAAAAAETKDEG